MRVEAVVVGDYSWAMDSYCPECQTRYEGDVTVCPEDGTPLLNVDSTRSGTNLLGVEIDGRFRIDSILGAGGMGAVFRATQLSVQREVAIKILRPELTDREEFFARFFREARVVSDLEHPNVVRLIDFGQDTDRDLLFLVMELVRGVALEELVQQGRLSQAMALEVVHQISGALTEPHRRGIIHRDLKPENLIVVPVSDGSVQVKVLDFGIAQVMEAETKLTQTGATYGTPAYMAPERSQQGVTDARSDLYSLGVLLFEMLTGEQPFVADTGIRVIFQHIFEEPPSLRGIFSDDEVHPEVVELVEDLMAKDPDRRPQTARAVRDRVDELRRKLASGPARIDPDAPAPFAAALLPRVPLPRPAAPDGEAVDPHGTTRSQWEVATRKAPSPMVTAEVAPERRAETTAQSSPEVPKRRRGLWIAGLGAVLLLMGCGGLVGLTWLLVQLSSPEELQTEEEAVAVEVVDDEEPGEALVEEEPEPEPAAPAAESRPARQEPQERRPTREPRRTRESERESLEREVIREVLDEISGPPGRGRGRGRGR